MKDYEGDKIAAVKFNNFGQDFISFDESKMRFKLSAFALPGNYTVQLTLTDKHELFPKTSNPYNFYIEVMTNLTEEVVDEFIDEITQGNITTPNEVYASLVSKLLSE